MSDPSEPWESWHPGFVDVWTVDVSITRAGRREDVPSRQSKMTYTFRCNPSHFLSMLNAFGESVMIAEGEESPGPYRPLADSD